MLEQPRPRRAVTVAAVAICLAVTAAGCDRGTSSSTSTSSAAAGRPATSSVPATTETTSAPTTTALRRVNADPGKFNRKDFGDPIGDANPWLPLVPGYQSVQDGTLFRGRRELHHRRRFTVTDVVKRVAGVLTVAVLDQDSDAGQIAARSSEETPAGALLRCLTGNLRGESCNRVGKAAAFRCRDAALCRSIREQRWLIRHDRAHALLKCPGNIVRFDRAPAGFTGPVDDNDRASRAAVDRLDPAQARGVPNGLQRWVEHDDSGIGEVEPAARNRAGDVWNVHDHIMNLLTKDFEQPVDGLA